MGKPLTIAMLGAEVAPFSKSGGLADVMGSLPKALRLLGHHVVVVTPFYEQLIDVLQWGLVDTWAGEIEIDADHRASIRVLRGTIEPDIPVYFIGSAKYFSQKKSIYGSTHDTSRFFLFVTAALDILVREGIAPDVIHCHDWHTGLAPYLLKHHPRWSREALFARTATLFTIHNLAFQMGKNWWEVSDDARDDGLKTLPSFHTPDFENINCAKRAILHAELINTVSEQYAEEILTKDFGQDLERILRNRKNRIFGIVNGIDEQEYNPATDPGLTSRYTPTTLERKTENKIALQQKYGLPRDPTIPLLSMVSRITEQKGFDLIIDVLPALLRQKLQLMILGSGNKDYERILARVKRKTKNLAVHLEFDALESTAVYAATDIFLMPSRFEPCGLGQMMSLRYGAIPVVRSVGGLAQTIVDFNPKTQHGNGFVFHAYEGHDLLIAITRALETYRHTAMWRSLVQKGMRESFSWEVPAHKYVLLYRRALKEKNKEL